MLRVLGNKKDKATSKKSSFQNPLPEGHTVDRDNFFCLMHKHASESGVTPTSASLDGPNRPIANR